MSSSERAHDGATLLLLPETFRTPGGIQTFNRNLVRALQRLQPENSLEVLVLNDRDADIDRGEWAGIAARGFDRAKVRFAVAALLGARRGPRRLILGHRNLLSLAPWLRRAGAVGEMWLIVFGIDAEAAMTAQERRSLDAVSRVLTISPQTHELFRAAGCGRSTELLPCALPFWWQLGEAVPPRIAPPIRLLTVSRLDPGDRYKGVDTTIAATAKLLAAGRQVRLDVVGDGVDRGRLSRLAAESGARDAVTFHGSVGDARLRELYAACDLFVLPSANEGFGIVYLEAMAHGKPCVAAGVGGAPFVVRPGGGGFLVPPGDPDALASLLEARMADPDGTRAAGLRAREFLEEHYTFDRFTNRLRDLLTS